MKLAETAADGAVALVSIALPTYNRIESLRRSLGSALAQDYPNLEVVISDNASADGTEAYCRAVQSSDVRVRYFRHEENQGAAENFRYAMQKASGEYVMWLADDDWLDQDYISRCMDLHRQYPDTILASGRGVFHMDDGEEKPGLLVDAISSSTCLRVLKYLMLVRDNSGFYGVGRRSDMLNIGMRNVLAGDWLYIMCLAYLGKLRMTQATWIHRSPGGVGTDLSRLVRAFGLPKVTQYFPYSVIAYNVAKELSTNPALTRQRTLCTRMGLAGLSALMVLLSHGIVWRLVRLSFQLLSRVAGRTGTIRVRKGLRRLVGL